MSDIKTTPFHQAHKDAGAKLVDFAGWELPIHYGSQIAEHEAVRTDAGMFDVSHMLVTDVTGEKAKDFFRKLLANDVAKLGFVGKALYSAMLNDQGGVIDDLIVYRGNEAETQYRIVSNGATREKDSAQFQKIGAEFGIKLTPRYDLAMLAVQGPKAVAKLLTVKPEWADTINGLKPFQGADLGNDWFVARTGYTGEDGVEVILPGSEAEAFFKALQQAGVKPCGLGARDTLREPLRQRHGRQHQSARSRHGLDGGFERRSPRFRRQSSAGGSERKRRERETGWLALGQRRHTARAHGSDHPARQRGNYQRRVLAQPQAIHRHRPRAENL